MIRQLLLVILCAAIVPHTVAGTLQLVVNGKTYHFQRDRERNESNWGVGLEYSSKQRGDYIPFVTISAFKDSYFEMSNYFGGGIKRRFQSKHAERALYLDVGAIAFVMSHKNHNDGEPFPGLLPFVSLGSERVALNIAYVPKVVDTSSNLLFLQLMVKVVDF